MRPIDEARPPTESVREQLIAIAGGYLAAIEAHDPSLAALAPDVQATENAVLLSVGEGLWQKAKRFASRQFFVDEVSGQVMIIGAVDCSGDLFPYGIRLGIEGGQVAQAETLLSPSARGHFANVDQMLRPDVLYDAPIPPERRCGAREALRSVGDLYWDGLNESDGSIPRFNHRCDRYANGKKITNCLELLLTPDAAVHTPASLITATRPAKPKVIERRFPVLDLVRGVAGSIVIIEFGKNADRPDVGAFYTFSVNKIVDDEIRNVDHLHVILPPGTRTPW